MTTARLHRIVVPACLLAFIAGATPAAEPVFPGDDWLRAEPGEVGMDAELLGKARDYALTGGGSGYITRHGRLVMSWGDAGRKYDLKSTSKSIGVTALALAIDDGHMKLSDKAREHHPSLGVPPESNKATGWLDEITILHLATQTAGFEKPGGYTKLVFRPGTKWLYSDGGPNWLAECVTLKYKRDVEDLLFDRVFTPIGIKKDDLHWRGHAYRDKMLNGVPRREFGSGVHANVDAMARIGYLYLRNGKWGGRQLIGADFIETARKPIPGIVGLPEHGGDDHGNASDHYGLLWWNNGDGTLKDVPRDAYWSWGLYDSLIVVIPSLDVVVSRAGRSWDRKGWNAHYDVLRPFLEPIVKAVGEVRDDGDCADSREWRPACSPVCADDDRPAPYPPSPVIAGVEWAPVDSITRKARGSDNWPLTWADDGHQYTAYGDGWGFEPRVEKKLSLGLARIEGPAESFRGVNVRSASAERTGDGRSGPKASGMLMVDGVLYMWARNADNARLAWSRDHGRTWQWADWRMTESFGFPSFLNYGKNYAGARDGCVYVYSFDSDSAYQPADRMVLARVPKDRIRERDAYTFFVRVGEGGEPVWSPDVSQRGAVFEHQGRCYRHGVTYNAPLKRYLWVQVFDPSGGNDSRFAGGLGVYDAPQPWGPWTTVYFTENWDVGPGECASFPVKWMSEDGKDLSLVFSGDDAFSVRGAKLRMRRD